MIEETAYVVAVQGAMAEVETQRRSACGDCSAKSGCGSAIFAELFGKRRSLIRVSNAIQARPGDQVVIGMHEAPFLKAALVLYAVPLLGLIGGALAAETLARRLAPMSLELASVIGGLLGLIGGLAGVRRFSARQRGNGAYQAVILRRVGTDRVFVDLT